MSLPLDKKETRMNDKQVMCRYIAHRLPHFAATRVELIAGREGVIADVTVLPEDDGTFEVEIDSNCPDWVTLPEVYHHYRCQEMTSFERRANFAYGRRRSDYDAKVKSLSDNERAIFEAADETIPCRGEPLVMSLPSFNHGGQTRGCLAHLVKLGLLRKNKGYLRVRRPDRNS